MARPSGQTADGVRRLRVRFSMKRKDDADFLAALDERCSSDSETQDFIRRCMLLGYAMQYNAGNLANLLASYTNKSHYAQTDASEPPPAGTEVKSGGDPDPPAGPNGVASLMGMLSSSNAISEVSQ